MANAAAQILPLLLAIFERIVLLGVLLRVMGPEAYADWVTVFSTVTMLTLVEFGLGIYFGNHWQSANARADLAELQRYLSISICTYLILCGFSALSLLIFAVYAPIVSLLELTVFQPAEASLILTGLGLATVLRILRGSVSQIYRGMQRFARGTVVSNLPQFVIAIITVIAALNGAEAVTLAMLALIVELFFGLVLLTLDIRFCFPALRLTPVLPTKHDFTAMVRLGKWFAIVQGVPTIWQQMPILFASRLTETAIVFVGFVSMRILSNFVRTLIEIFVRAFAVEIVPMFHRGEINELNRMLMFFGGLTTCLVGALMGYLTVYAEPLLTLWTGDAQVYDPAVLWLLLLPTVAVVPALPLRMIFEFANKPRVVALAMLIQIGILVVLLSFVPLSDPVLLVSSALALAEVFGFLGFLLLRIRHLMELNLRRYLAVCLICFVSVFPMAWVIARTTTYLVVPNGLVSFLVSSTTWLALIFVAAVGAFRSFSIWSRDA